MSKILEKILNSSDSRGQNVDLLTEFLSQTTNVMEPWEN
jgi:hypothetical protein